MFLLIDVLSVVTTKLPQRLNFASVINLIFYNIERVQLIQMVAPSFYLNHVIYKNVINHS